MPPLVPDANPVPPRATDNSPLQPNVNDAAAISAIDGEPPSVSVTFVSSVFVRAAAVIPICPVTASSVIGAAAEAAKVPVVFGNVSVGEPATICGVIVAVPLVAPANPIVPVNEPGTPRTGVAVATIVSAALRAFKIVPRGAVAGYVAVDQEGAELTPERGIWPAVAVPESTANPV